MRQCHVFFNAQVFASAGHGVLKNTGHTVGTVPDRASGHVFIGNMDAAFIHALVARDRIQEGGLARSVGANDGDKLAVRNFQRQTAQRARFNRGAGVEGEFEVLCAQHRFTTFFCGRIKACGSACA